MSLLWPGALVCMLAVPAILAFYLRLDRRRHMAELRHPALYPRPSSAGGRRLGLHHVPLAFFLLSLALACIALARPQALVPLFGVRGTVVLALDVSTSMRAVDVQPSRLAHAQSLAKDFVARYADDIRIGLVSFGARSSVELEPTTDREALFAAIDRLAVQQGTAIGNGLAVALAMIFPEADINVTSARRGGMAPAGGGNSVTVLASGAAAIASGHGDGPASPARSDGPRRPPRPADSPGSYSAAAIVLITDGDSTEGPDPNAAAALAAELGVRVHAIGIGTAEGTPMRMRGWSVRVQLDEAALKRIVLTTRGEYLGGSGAIDWSGIVQSIQPLPPRPETYTEVTGVFAAAAALAALCGAVVSLQRTRRVL